MRTAIVGGGWAGLAAAIEATTRGHRVTLFEMAPQLGGRARSVATRGETLDNGQHIMIGAYTATLRLMRTVGVDVGDAFERRPLEVLGPTGPGLTLAAGPSLRTFPLAVLRRQGWTWADRMRLLAWAGRRALSGFECDGSRTVSELTASLPLPVRETFIDPLCIAALNTPSSDASGRVFLRVIRDALFAGAGSSDLLLPRRRLGDLLPAPAHAWLTARGATVARGTRIEHIATTADGWQVDGDDFDHVILATPPNEAERLTRGIAPEWAACAAGIGYEPIVTVYARSPGATLRAPMLMLPSDDRHHPAQFVFDHGALGTPGLLAFVISGAAPWVSRGTEATQDAVMRQARSQLAGQLGSSLAVVRVLTEKRATFRCVPGLVRPRASIAPGLHAAGDHVDGPYPATLEGAVRSGIHAARAIG